MGSKKKGLLTIVERRIVPAWIVLSVLSVDISAIVSNDSVGYLKWARSPFSKGFVGQGYRQVAYPLWIWITDALAQLMDWDRLFSVALAQRLLLLFAFIALWRMLRWWVMPFLLVALNPSYIVHADFVLSEGLLVSLCPLAAVGLIPLLHRKETLQRRPLTYLTAMSFLGFVLASLKLQYGSFLLLALLASLLIWKFAPVRRANLFIPILISFCALSFVVAGQALDNRTEIGVLEPVSQRERVAWVFAYQSIFNLNSTNMSNPNLADLYDSGNLYVFLHGLETSEPNYLYRRELIEDRIDLLFSAAETSRRAQQLKSFFGALGGGRFDDTAGMVERSIQQPASQRATFNSLLNRDLELVTSQLNEGKPPGILTLGPLGETIPTPFGDHRKLFAVLSYLAIAVSISSLLVPGRHRIFAIAGLIPTIFSGVALSSVFADNFRYLMGPLSFTIIMSLSILAYAAQTRSTNQGVSKKDPV